jgi:hypothetical protein
MHQPLDSPNESVCPDSEGTPQINMILHFHESPYLFLFFSQGSILQKGCTRIMINVYLLPTLRPIDIIRENENSANLKQKTHYTQFLSALLAIVQVLCN